MSIDINEHMRRYGPDATLKHLDSAKPEARRANGKDNGKAQPGTGSYSMQDLQRRTFAPLKQVVGHIIVEGLTLIASRPKVGKTWLALDMAVAVGRGGICLGDIKCAPGNVLFLALEDNERRMQRRMTKLLGTNEQWPDFTCAHVWPRADKGGLDAIREWIAKADKPRLVIIDVLAAFRKIVPGKQSYDADYEAIAELQRLASETGVAIVVIHHTRKGEANDPIDAVSGTLGLAGAADAVLVIERNLDGVRLSGRSRDVDEIDKAIEFNRNICRWTILGDTADVHRGKEQQNVLDMLASGPMTLANLATGLSKARPATVNLLNRMAKSGEVIRTGHGRYARAESQSNGVNA
jgi:hypothetical protein